MKILAIYPGFDPDVNDIAQALIHISNQGHEVRVITAQKTPSKSRISKQMIEKSSGITIYRPFSSFNPDMLFLKVLKKEEIKEILQGYEPDILLCSQVFTISLGLYLKRILKINVPIVVVSEFSGDLADKGYGGIVANVLFPLIGMPRGKNFWPWLCKQSDAIIACYPGDIERLDELCQYGVSTYHVPWCNQLPDGFEALPKKEKDLAVYIGTFSKWKNTDYFEIMIPAILDNTPTNTIQFVGSGKVEVIKNLKNKFGNRIEHLNGLPRKEALQLLSNAFYGITPIKRGGWGFIGDCWAVKTPLVCVHNDYRLNNRIDAIVGNNIQGLISGINALYENPQLYQDIQENGFNRYFHNHSAEAVGKKYEQVLKNTITVD